MEVIFPTFMRVRRGLTDAPHIQALFEHLENNSNGDTIPLNEADRLAILDFPNPDLLSTTLALATNLPKQTLLERAASMPEELTNEELKLLTDRYWPKPTLSEAGVRNRACENLDNDGTGGISARRGRSKKIFADIEKLREPYYDPHESTALSNARSEMSRRTKVFLKQQQQQRDEENFRETLASSRCPGWAKHFLREQRVGLEGEFWGFARFVDPEVGVGCDLDRYGFRAAEVLYGAREVLGSLRSGFTLDLLDWPEGEEDEDEDEEEEEETDDDNDSEDDGDALIVDLEDERLRRIDDRDLAEGKEESGDAPSPVNANNVDWVDDEDDEELIEKFKILRKRFRSIRKIDGLDRGTLSNTSIVIDDACVFSLLEAPRADNAWVWAVDPDYDYETNVGTVFTCEEGSQRRYRGFLRVGLQHLVDKFFEARKYQEEEYPMAALWQAAQRNSNRAFVSTEEEK